MSKWTPSVLVALTTLLCAPLVHGTIYKWQDEQGITHFSDATPVGRRFETVPQPRLPPANSVTEEAARTESCRRAMGWLAILESRPGSRIKITEPDGTQRRLTEEERQTRLAMVQKQITNSCAD